jgi:hypothetical protein
LLNETGLTPIEFFHRFRGYLHLLGKDISEMAQGLYQVAYLKLFAEFILKLYRDVNCSQEQVCLFLVAEKPRGDTFVNRYKTYKLCSPNVFSNGRFMDMIPVLPRTTQFLSLSYDPDELFLQFLEDGRIINLPTDLRFDFICFLPRKYVSIPSLLGFNVVKPNELTGYIIKHINGSNTCSEIANKITNIVKASQRQILHDAIKKNIRKMIYSGILMLSGECL